MARRKTAIVGLIGELSVQIKLAKDPNILVFTPLGGLGPVDIVTLNIKQDYTSSDGYKRKRTGSLIYRGTTKEQKKLKVKIIYATI